MQACSRCHQHPALPKDYWCRECRKAHLRAYIKTPKGRAARAAYVKVNRQRIRDNARAGRKACREFIESLKTGPCVDCTETYPPYCMDFDHVRGPKRRGVSNMVTYSREAILAEVAKCDLVCACCHRVRTDARRAPSVKLAGIRAKLNSLKGAPCSDCARKFPPVSMDFDHVRGVKARSVGLMKEQSWHKVLEEISKCDLVCAVCHRKRTFQRGKNENGDPT